MHEVPLHPFRNSAVFNPLTHLFYIPSNPWRVTLRLERLVNRNSGIKKKFINYCVLNLIRYLWNLRNEMVFRTLYKKFRLWNLGKLFSFMINLNLFLVNKHRVAPTQTNTESHPHKQIHCHHTSGTHKNATIQTFISVCRKV